MQAEKEPSMRETIHEHLSKLLERLDNGLDWTVEQIPPLAEEVLKYYAAVGWYRIALIVIFLFILWWFRNSFMSKINSDESNDKEDKMLARVASAAVAAFISIFPSMELFNSIEMVLKVHLAPRLFLLPKIAELF